MNGAPEDLGMAGRLAQAFIHSKLTPLLLIASVGVGALALVELPREEEPQIVVPMVDVFVGMPGASAKEVEERVTAPMERLLWEIPGVEYVYSTSGPGQSLAIVRFLVGEDEERSLVRLQDKLSAHGDIIPPGASRPLIKPRSIDDVPVLGVTLWSRTHDGHELRRLAAEVQASIKQVRDVSEVTLIGGERRQVRVTLDPVRLSARGVDPLRVAAALQAANSRLPAGTLSRDNREILLESGGVLRTVDDVERVVVGAWEGRPVFLADVAHVRLGPEEAGSYVSFAAGAAAEGQTAAAGDGAWPAVTISVAKRKGVNAVGLVAAVMQKIRALEGTVIPKDVTVTVTRDYGETAEEKSNELLLHMGIAVLSVALLIGLTLGRREAGIVMLAIPATLALTLAVFYLYGYTLNRITLFALIFSIGILVDDAIVVVENIARHRQLPENRGASLAQVAVRAVAEVGNPTILATMTVVGAILPMAFVGGLMGPYMRPIPVGATAAMVFSLIVAFVVTPWATVRLLSKPGAGAHHEEGHVRASERLYRRLMAGLLGHARWRYLFLGSVVVLLLGSMALVGVGWVKVKMLPFDNKSELQVMIDLPEGSTLEQTARVARALSTEIGRQPEVRDIESYVGTSGPFNFNGLVRHYYLRQGANVADLQVNLVGKGERDAQSHAVAKRLREVMTPIAQRFGARIKVAEVPPGPPVLQTLVAEVYGPDPARRVEIAGQIRALFESTPGVVDVDWYVEDDRPKLRLAVDEEKAALAGVRVDELVRVVSMATAGETVGLLHRESARGGHPHRAARGSGHAF
ncbi:MAG: efflux RND transporter permease subunit [Myxococcales bacterium]|nr:efflux RND transporter permease subunit [Myxococcales bacterium]